MRYDRRPRAHVCDVDKRPPRLHDLYAVSLSLSQDHSSLRHLNISTSLVPSRRTVVDGSACVSVLGLHTTMTVVARRVAAPVVRWNILLGQRRPWLCRGHVRPVHLQVLQTVVFIRGTKLRSAFVKHATAWLLHSALPWPYSRYTHVRDD